MDLTDIDYINFLKKQAELKMLARNSVLFCALPDDLRDFEEEIYKHERSPGVEKIIDFLIGLFKEEKERVDEVVSMIKEARAKMAE